MQISRKFKSQGTLGLGGTSEVTWLTPASSDEETVGWRRQANSPALPPPTSAAICLHTCSMQLRKERPPGVGDTWYLAPEIVGSGVESVQ